VKATTLHRSDFVQQNAANTKTNNIYIYIYIYLSSNDYTYYYARLLGLCDLTVGIMTILYSCGNVGCKLLIVCLGVRFFEIRIQLLISAQIPRQKECLDV
jgi:hypothetical protein